MFSVAGGGGNANVSYNNGAGAGGMVVQNGVTVTKGAFTVTIGAGGNAHPDGSGTNSSIVDSSSNSITTNAIGGGGGNANSAASHSGGSGAGGSSRVAELKRLSRAPVTVRPSNDVTGSAPSKMACRISSGVAFGL